ncbi:hypothetical protein [Methylobacterium isbiliense]|uniref:hypothetical protein n=1 Tax=Methylobacterium isbiliense TaxID=315478 RepID=UPI00338F4F4D|nr:RES family NAD+ phosphorylase [Methylobacterium sp.]
MADRLIADGAPGVRVPSARGRGINLVLWQWKVGPASPRVVALDPLADLPRDQSSWSTCRGRRAGLEGHPAAAYVAIGRT